MAGTHRRSAWRTPFLARTSPTAFLAACACAFRPGKGIGFFEGTVANLRGHPSILSVRASARTASITMEHDGDAQEIARLAREAGIFDLPEAAVVQLLAERFEGRIVGVKPDSLVSVGLAGLGVYQAMRGQFLGSGV